MKNDWQIQQHGWKRKLHKRIYSYLCTKYLYYKACEAGEGCKANALVKLTKKHI